jgi:hypothetical protein
MTDPWELLSYYEISLDETRSIIDAVVAVIERIDQELNGMFGRASIWLLTRIRMRRSTEDAELTVLALLVKRPVRSDVMGAD